MRAMSCIAAASVVCVVTASRSPAADSFVNWESPQVHPLDLTPDGSRLLAVNTADARLEVFDATGDRLIWLGCVPVGLDPVSVRALSKSQAWVVNHVSDTVSVVDLEAMNVVATIRTLDEPCDAVFSGNPPRAYVSCSQANTVQVFNPEKLDAPPVSIAIQGEDPRALAASPDGRFVFVAIFESGNGTTILGGGSTGDGTISFPKNVVNDPLGPYGGVNPPPNHGTEFLPPINPALPDPPGVGLIVRKSEEGRWLDDNAGDWTEMVSGELSDHADRPRGWDLPDRDVAVIDTTTLSVTYVRRLMNLCMAISVNPISGKLTVVGTEAMNQIRYEPNVQGRFIRVHVALVDADGANPSIQDLNPHLNYETPRIDPDERLLAIGDPRGVVWNAAGTRAYVAGKGSNNVVVLGGEGRRIAGPFAVGEGPGGLALSKDGARLYVLNHFSNAISTLTGLEGDALIETERVPLSFDPTPSAIATGRKHLYDTHRNSGLGHIACASCHVDARMDRLAWDLGNPAGEMKPFNQNCLPVFDGACQDWHPMKGPMMTQTLQDIVGKEPHHWRGDRDGIEEFAGAFVGLQGGDRPLPASDMQEFEDFLATIHFPPNPFRNLDNSLPVDLPLAGHYSDGRFADSGGLQAGEPLPSGNAQRALGRYRTGRMDGGQIDCVSCHTLPTGMGSNLRRVNNRFEDFPLGPNGEFHHFTTSLDGSTNKAIKIPQLRTGYEKVGCDFTQVENRSGFGFIHDGSVDSITRFVSEPVFQMRHDQEVADFVAFMMAFSGSDLPVGNNTNFRELRGPDSQDTHAAVGVQVTLTAANHDDPTTRRFVGQLRALAATGRVGLIIKGTLRAESRGWMLATHHVLQSDRKAEQIRFRDLVAAAGDGAELTVTVVPAGTEQRMGIDRDEDGHFDRDEQDAGCNPNDPSSHPGNGGCE
ncbi:MAG: YncE family protein [Phycisphaerales bacterium]|nr:YncE family protein [Phycisphaerales bacterium]